MSSALALKRPSSISSARNGLDADGYAGPVTLAAIAAALAALQPDHVPDVPGKRLLRPLGWWAWFKSLFN